jgi:hypothetical protein
MFPRKLKGMPLGAFVKFWCSSLKVGYLGGITRFGRQQSCADFIEVFGGCDSDFTNFY